MYPPTSAPIARRGEDDSVGNAARQLQRAWPRRRKEHRHPPRPRLEWPVKILNGVDGSMRTNRRHGVRIRDLPPSR